MAKKKTKTETIKSNEMVIYGSNFSVEPVTKKPKYRLDRKGQKIVEVVNNKGQTIILINPDQRGRKYANDLKNGVDGFTGEKLTVAQKVYRGGYLRSRSDSAKAWCAKNGVPSKAKKRWGNKNENI